MAKTYEFEFDAPPEQLFQETVSAVSALGFSILQSENGTTSLTFNTGASIWSNAGQDMTATAEPLPPSASKLVVGGRAAPRGNEAQYGSWGERGRIAKGLAAKVREALADPVTVASDPPNEAFDGRAFVAELATLAQLHRAGSLTDGEFERAKQRLLSS